MLLHHDTLTVMDKNKNNNKNVCSKYGLVNVDGLLRI
jgi:hypothetical protein